VTRHVLAFVLLLALAPATAHAQGGFGTKNCSGPLECTRVEVPLDRSGAVPGTVPLYVERTPEGGSEPIFALAGGPGQGATELSLDFTRNLGPILEDGRYLVVMDQRGTGRSGVIDCKPMQRQFNRPVDRRAEQCGEQLGERSHLYATRDSVEDIEAVRRRVGAERITLFGVSYGTKVAVAYALKYPEHVDRLILDSVVAPEGQDPFDRDSFAALPRILAELCRDECDDVTGDLAADLATLGDQLEAAPLRGRFVTRSGKARTVTVSARRLYRLVRGGDVDPSVRAEYPAAIRSAVEGDPAPLLRQVHRFDYIKPWKAPVPREALRQQSLGLFTATLCEETPLPWERTAPPGEERLRQARERAEALPDSAFEPFHRGVALARDNDSALFQCSRWPAEAQEPTLAGIDQPYPDVPVLVIQGLEDIRTPLEIGQRVAARFQRATVLEVPKAGHGATADEPGCVGKALRRFVGGRAIGTPCAKAQRAAVVVAKLPGDLADVAPAPGTSGKPGRTLAATVLTIADAQRETQRHGDPRGGGLRGGTYALARDGRVRLDDLSLVPGVTVSGRLARFDRLPAGTVRVDGPAAAAGTLTLERDGTVRGRLGGRAVGGEF
jgi:pimeloyl-ACP methyl ester carboxylesterase